MPNDHPDHSTEPAASPPRRSSTPADEHTRRQTKQRTNRTVH